MGLILNENCQKLIKNDMGTWALLKYCKFFYYSGSRAGQGHPCTMQMFGISNTFWDNRRAKTTHHFAWKKWKVAVISLFCFFSCYWVSVAHKHSWIVFLSTTFFKLNRSRVSRVSNLILSAKSQFLVFRNHEFSSSLEHSQRIRPFD